MSLAKIWHNRIIAGTRTFDEVPQAWRAQVKVLFKADVVNGIISEEEYAEIVGEPYEV